MATTRVNLTIEEGALADARDIAEQQHVSLSDYVTRVLEAANTEYAERGAQEWEQTLAQRLHGWDQFVAEAHAELARTPITGKADHAA
ncbi:DUF6364 family protein (plasmid) [Microtetraspora malaysiensis]|uniref:DUF6364 family protein n=1 Tax=Microtetraspora malaysiensis TaxID=161358 RepID=UPI003D8CD813